MVSGMVAALRYSMYGGEREIREYFRIRAYDFIAEYRAFPRGKSTLNLQPRGCDWTIPIIETEIPAPQRCVDTLRLSFGSQRI